ncbi:ATP-dependent RNA helicase HrpA [Pasteurella multocida]|nr:ATP-dependent RNA helicase HrpA [Pasteurella multocida]
MPILRFFLILCCLKKQPKWVMAAELVETSRLWGRMVADIEPEWIEPLALHLVKKILRGASLVKV